MTAEQSDTCFPWYTVCAPANTGSSSLSGYTAGLHSACSLLSLPRPSTQSCFLSSHSPVCFGNVARSSSFPGGKFVIFFVEFYVMYFLSTQPYSLSDELGLAGTEFTFPTEDHTVLCSMLVVQQLWYHTNVMSVSVAQQQGRATKLPLQPFPKPVGLGKQEVSRGQSWDKMVQSNQKDIQDCMALLSGKLPKGRKG